MSSVETFVNLSDYPDPDTEEFFALSPEEKISIEYYNILTQEATAVKPGSRVISHLWCVEDNEQGDLCQGEIELIRIQLPSEIRWKCPRCGQHGKITGFEDGPSDLSHLPEEEARQFIEESYGMDMDKNGPGAVFEDHTGGLNPKQLYNLLRCDWEKNEGPLLLNGKLAAKEVSGSILFHNARTMLLKAQKEGGLGLTQTGNLQRKPISELMPECIWPDNYHETIKEYNKVVNEHDIWLLHSTRILLELAGLLRKHKKALKGLKKLAGLSLGSRSGELYRHLFITYFKNMNISYLSNDMYDYPNVQENIPFALFRMQQLAEDWVSVNELTENIMVPMAFNDIATRVNSYTEPGDLVYSLVLEPLELFGLIETRKTGDESKRSYRPDQCRKTLLFDKFISFRF